MGKIGQAFTSDKKVVLLIDEIDKADTDFQDDMLDISIRCNSTSWKSTGRCGQKTAGHRDHLQREERSVRSVFGALQFHHIAFPDREMMRRIIDVHFPDLNRDLTSACLDTFYRLREVRGVEKKPPRAS